jgi:hypothetical protein
VDMAQEKECEQCGTDISRRNARARFCFPCCARRQMVSSLNSAQRSDRHAKHEAVRKITKAAVRYGFLPNPSTMTCADCGRPAECYDHRDYNKPLDVDPVCISCNSQRGAGIPLDRDLFAAEPHNDLQGAA